MFFFRSSSSSSPVLLSLLGLFLLGHVSTTINYHAELAAVDLKLTQLASNISSIQSIAHHYHHTQVQELCQDASASLSLAQSAWENIVSAFAFAPWLASGSLWKTLVQKHLDVCGTILHVLFRHPIIKLHLDLYQTPVQDCQNTFTTCRSACRSIWSWPPPPPTPSGGYSRRKALARRTVDTEQLQICPAGEVACPISSTSDGFECINTQQELTSCGGCVTRHQGENCMDILGAAGVGCMLGECVVLSVQPGYHLGRNGRPLLRPQSKT